MKANDFQRGIIQVRYDYVYKLVYLNPSGTLVIDDQDKVCEIISNFANEKTADKSWFINRASREFVYACKKGWLKPDREWVCQFIIKDGYVDDLKVL